MKMKIVYVALVYYILLPQKKKTHRFFAYECPGTCPSMPGLGPMPLPMRHASSCMAPLLS